MAVGAGAVLLGLRARVDAGLLDVDETSLRRIAYDVSQRYLGAGIGTAPLDGTRAFAGLRQTLDEADHPIPLLAASW